MLYRFTIQTAGILMVAILVGTAQADSVVQINLNGQVNGLFGLFHSFQVQLLDSQAPITVDNYLNYINSDRYDNTIIHRDIHNFVMQGGGFEPVVNEFNVVTALDPIPVDPPIDNEFSPTRSNVRGTIAMAKIDGNPNSATSQWFVNLANNSANLDFQNGGFTVFGRVIGEGMTLIDGVDTLQTYNLNPLYDPTGILGSPFSQVPLMGGSTMVTVTSVTVVSKSDWKGGNGSGPTNWDLAANWNPDSGVPDGPGTNVSFGSQAPANNIVDLPSADRTVGNIYFSTTTNTTIQSSGAHSLRLNNNGSFSTISAMGAETISANVILNNNVLVSGFNGSGSLNVSGGISGTGGLTVLNLGALILTGTNTYTGNTRLYASTLTAAKAVSLPGYDTPGKVTVNTDAGLAVRAGALTGEWTAPEISSLLSNATFNSGSLLGINTTGGNFSYGNAIAGSLGLSKLGANTLTLAGANTFTGPVNFNGGLIQAAALNNLGNGAALNFNGGGLQFNGTFDPSVRTMTFQAGGATLDTQNNIITLANAIGNGGTGELTKDGNGSLILNASPTYKGATVINNGTLQLGAPVSGVTLPTTATVTLITSGATLDTSGNSQTIASLLGLAGEVKLGNGTLTTGSDNTSTAFAGALTSTTGGSLTKVGTGTFTLSGINTFNGPVNFNGGLIKATALNNLGNGTALNFNGGGLQFDGVYDPSVRTMTFEAGGATLDTQANNITMANAIGNGGAGGLTKKGVGTLTLIGANTYSGNTIVSAGTLTTGKAASLPGYNALGKVTVNTGATLAVRAGASTGEWADSEINTLLSNATFIAGSLLGIDTTGGNFSYDNNIGGNLGLTKLGTNILTLTGTNTYSGNTLVNSGTLMITKAASLPGYNLAGKVTVTPGAMLAVRARDATGEWAASQINTLLSNATFNTGALLGIDTTGGNFAYGNVIGGSLGLIKLGANTLTLTGASTYTGGTTINAGTLLLSGEDNRIATTGAINVVGGVLDLGGKSQGTSTSPQSGDVIFQGGTVQNGTINKSTTAYDGRSGTVSAILAGAVGLNKTTSGLLTLSGLNTFTGDVNFNAGLIKASASDNLGNNSNLIFNGGGLQFGAPFDPSANHTMTFLAGGATLDTQANNITLDNAIGNGGAGELTKDGNGSLILNASPTYKGATIINNGTLQLGSPGSGVTLPTTTSVNLISSSGATLDTSGNSQTIASLLGLAGEVKLGNGTLTTGSDNISTTFAGTLSGSTGGSLTKVGTGTFTLTGEISYGGVTAINAGTLKINNNLSTTLNAISGAGALTVDGASTVLNASSINVDTLTIGAGAKVTLTQLLGDGSEKVIIPVPEPSLITLIGSTALGMIAYAWRRRKLAL